MLFHKFGKAYGWTKDYVLDNLYPDEIPILLKIIADDEEIEYKEKLSDFMTLIMAIHSENPNELFDELKAMVQGDENAGKPYWEVLELDRVAMDKAKAELQKVNDFYQGKKGG